MAANCYWRIFKYFPIPSRNAFRNAARRAAARLPCKLSKSWFAPLGSENSHFFKWLFTRMAVSIVSGRESSRSWRRAVWCSRTLASVSGCDPLSKATIPHCKFTHLAKIEESATRPSMLSSAISPPSWRVTTEFLLIVLFYQAMKPTDNAYPSHAIVYRRHATSAIPMRDIFSTKFSLKRYSAGGKCVYSVTWHL